jgi:hypothetical protein
MRVYILTDHSRWCSPVRGRYSCAVDAAEAKKKFPNTSVVDWETHRPKWRCTTDGRQPAGGGKRTAATTRQTTMKMVMKLKTKMTTTMATRETIELWRTTTTTT